MPKVSKDANFDALSAVTASVPGDVLDGSEQALVFSTAAGGTSLLAVAGGASNLISLTTGAGGGTVTGTGGAAGALNLVAGAGGTASGAGTGGAAGALNITAGAGGGTTAGTGVAGGTVTVTAGAGSADDGDGGDVNFVPGALDGTGAGGEVLVNATGFVDAQISFSIAADMVNTNFFVANRSYQIKAVREVHAVVSDGASTVEVEKCTGTQAPGSGVDIATATFDMTGTANTVLTGTLTGTAADLILVAGNRLALVYTGTSTGCIGQAIDVLLAPLNQ